MIPRARIQHRRSQLCADAFRALLSADAGKPASGRLAAAFARQLGRRHGIMFPHARTALSELLQTLDFSAGAEIILTPVTTPHIVSAIVLAGFRPVLVDIDPDTLAMSPEALADAVTPRTVGVLVTSLFGVVPDMPALVAECDRHGLVLIEDISQAIGSRHRDVPLGCFGIAAIYSTSISKDIDCYGGGLLLTDDASLANRLRTREEQLSSPSRMKQYATICLTLAASLVLTATGIRVLRQWLMPVFARLLPSLHGFLLRGEHGYQPPGHWPASWSRRFSALQERAGLRQLETLEIRQKQRQENIRQLTSGGLPDGLRIPPGAAEGKPVYWQLAMITGCVPQERVSAQLAEQGLDCGPMLLPVCSELPAFGSYASESLTSAHSRAGRLKRHTLIVPAYGGLSPASLERIRESIQSAAAPGTGA